MSRLIYKQRCKPPFDRETPVKNMRHIEYIATKPEAIKDAECGHALFGKLSGMEETGVIRGLDRVMKAVREKSWQRTNIYRSIISFSEADASKLGLIHNRAAWEQLISHNISTIADALNIPMSRLEWVAAAHMKKGHPHVHLVFWDGHQGVKSYFTPPEVTNDIRKKLIQEVFRDELENLYFSQNEAKSDIRTYGGGFFDDFTGWIDNMDSADFLRYQTKIRAVSRAHNLSGVAFSGFSDKRLDEIARELAYLKSVLPPRGSLKYASLPEETKAAVNRLAVKVLSSGKDLSGAFERYVDAETGIAAMYSTNPNTLHMAKKRAEDKALKMVGNQIINAIRTLNQKEWESNGELYQRKMSNQLFLSVFALMSGAANQSEERHRYMRLGGDLSKQAKIEYAKQMESKGLDWGIDDSD